MTRPLVRLENVDVALDGRTVLRGLHWCLRPGEHWAIRGRNGSGKSTLLKLIRGELWPAPGSGRRVYSFDGHEQTSAVGIKEKIALVAPETQDRYLQLPWQLTAWQVVQSGVLGGDYVYQKLTAAQRELARSNLRLLGVDGLQSRDVQQLSTGELRRILVARALTGSPRLLVCDEICDGLDPAARANLLEALQRVARNGTQLLHCTHRSEELLPAITHHLVLDRGRIVEQTKIFRAAAVSEGPAAARRLELAREELPTPPNGRRAAASPSDTAAVFVPRKRVAPSPNRPQPGSSPGPRSGGNSEHSRTLISLRRANVLLGGRPVLRNIDLEIRSGQHWAILGPNGAGKSTLLKLILGDWSAAVGGRVQRFAFASRASLWEVKRKIGYLSPELQARYREPITGAEAIASGFFSSVGLRQKVTPRQQRKVSELVDAFRLHALAGSGILQMSYGELRKILLARALVHDPELLLCDEPFDGLDAEARADMGRTLEKVARRGTSLVVVTHHLNELPVCTAHVIEMKAGRIVFQGAVADFSPAS